MSTPFHKLTIAQLRKIASDYNKHHSIKGYSKLKKDELATKLNKTLDLQNGKVVVRGNGPKTADVPAKPAPRPRKKPAAKPAAKKAETKKPEAKPAAKPAAKKAETKKPAAKPAAKKDNEDIDEDTIQYIMKEDKVNRSEAIKRIKAERKEIEERIKRETELSKKIKALEKEVLKQKKLDEPTKKIDIKDLEKMPRDLVQKAVPMGYEKAKDLMDKIKELRSEVQKTGDDALLYEIDELRSKLNAKVGPVIRYGNILTDKKARVRELKAIETQKKRKQSKRADSEIVQNIKRLLAEKDSLEQSSKKTYEKPEKPTKAEIKEKMDDLNMSEKEAREFLNDMYEAELKKYKKRVEGVDKGKQRMKDIIKSLDKYKAKNPKLYKDAEKQAMARVGKSNPKRR